ncbi:MAG: hypothetical protein Q8N26_36365 [Myxococcales bacterium]|nr:hypothetical protein [Myxococcales bacterium]
MFKLQPLVREKVARMGNLRIHVGLAAALVLSACPLPSGSDAGPDASLEDAGVPDAGTPDASMPPEDAGVIARDGGGSRDGSVPDWCLSYPEPTRLPDGGLERSSSPWTSFDGGFARGPDGGMVALGSGEVTPLAGCFETDVVETDWVDAGAIRRLDPKDYRGCGTNQAGCPPAGTPPQDQWFFAPDATVPFVPFDEPTSPTPTANMPCTAGQAWGFESGRYTPWTGSLMMGTNDLAVYGNNVSIDRILPPGYQRDGGPGTHVGGDYWEFSRDINYRGRYWAGTSDMRQNWRTRPGARLADTSGFVLESPPFVIATPYLSFLIGGARRTTQRVELVIVGNPNNTAQLMAQYRGLNVEESASGGAFTLEPRPMHVVVRASTSLEDNEYMRRRVFWSVQNFQNLTAYFRIVDTAGEAAHVNADDFRCEGGSPPNIQWLPLPDGGLANPQVGQTVKDVPLWGVTDTHTHVAANMTLGGHYIWGDANDLLENVYDCNRPLPAIRDKSMNVVREAIGRPNKQTQCFVSAGIIGLITSTGAGVCLVTASALGAVPFIGPALVAITLTACTVALSVAATALTAIPSLTSVTLHGASMPTSGGLRAGPLIQFLIRLFDRELVRKTIIHGMIEQQDWDTADGFHSGFGASYLHQRYHWTMIQRAWQGGLRLMVIDALHSRALQYVLDGRDDMDDWQAFKLTADAVERLTAGPTHPRFDQGKLFGIAELALTPGQARDIVRRNKLAIVLGTETQELGKLRSSTDSIEQQVRDLYEMGYRKVTPIHGIDNPLGGTGYFNDIYNSAAVFANLSKDERSMADGVWGPGIRLDVTLPSSLPAPLGGMTLQSSNNLVQSLRPITPCVGTTCPWNLRAGGWFSVKHPSTIMAPDFIGELDAITFRAGLEGSTKGRTITEHNPLAEPDFKFASRVSNLNWLLGNGPGGVVLGDRRCSLDGMFMPLVGEVDTVAADQYQSTGRQMNDRGLSTEGRAFIAAMMARGMIIDSDHLGQMSRVDLHRELAAFRADAGAFETQEYPVLGIHTDVRRFQRHTAYPLDAFDGGSAVSYASQFGFNAEVDKTRAEIAHIAANGGALSPGINGGFIQDPDGLVGDQVRNNCDYSTKSFAIKYMQMIRLTGGRGVTPSTDNNSPSPRVVSRFGNETACFSGDSPERIEGRLGDDDLPIVGNWPRDFHPSVAARCRFNSVGGRTLSGTFYPLDESCPGLQNVRTQFLEANAVEYEDYDTRPTTGTPFAGRPDLRTIVAQAPSEFRDDRALAGFGVEQTVAYGGGGPLSQIRPMRKFRTNVYPSAQNRGWDFNIDGLANEGLLPDIWQDMRNVGVSWEQLGPMFNSANDFIDMWDRACRLSAQWHRGRGAMPLSECN